MPQWSCQPSATMAPPAPVSPSPTFIVMSPPLPPTALPVLIEMLPLAPAVWESPVASPFAAVAGGAASAGLHGHVAAVARCATCSGRQRHRAAVGCGANTCRDRHCQCPPAPAPEPAVSDIAPPWSAYHDAAVVLPAVSDMAPPAPVSPSPTFMVMSPPLPPTALPVLIEMLPLAPAVGESPVASPFAAVAGGAASAGLHGHVAAVARCATCSGRQRHRAAVGCGANTCRDRHCAASARAKALPQSHISPPVLVLVDEDADGSSDAPALMVSLPPVALLDRDVASSSAVWESPPWPSILPLLPVVPPSPTVRW